MQKSLLALQRYYVNHRGNQHRKVRADTHHAYKTIRLCLEAWKVRYAQRVAHREKTNFMHEQVQERMKFYLFAEWKQYVLSRQLRKAQAVTAVEASRQSMKSKVFLSLKFFTKYVKKQSDMTARAVEYHRNRKISVGWSSLRLWVECAQHRRAKA